MQLRCLHRADRDRLLQIWNAAAPYDRMTDALLEEKIWRDDDADPELALVAASAGAVLGFGVGVVRDVSRGYLKLLAVAEDQRRQGVGTALLEAIEAGLAARGATSVRIFESAPNYLVPGVDARYREARAFAGARGYRVVGEAYNLEVDLAAPVAAGAAPGALDIRRAARDDETGLHELLDAEWPAWAAEAGAALANSPPTLFIARREARVVGFAAWDANNRGTGWFGPMGVAPDERHKGVGRALLQSCLDDMRRQGHDAAVIAWADNEAFYARCAGARRTRTFIRFEKTLHAS
jgi:predicted N-acetyltransferase YhbS